MKKINLAFIKDLLYNIFKGVLMKLTKFEEEISTLKNKIDDRFHKNYLKKLEELKNKITKYRAQQIYKKASKNLYERISKIR
jgi:hypothetical protein